jgi:hypothetical protein
MSVYCCATYLLAFGVYEMWHSTSEVKVKRVHVDGLGTVKDGHKDIN